MIQKRILTAVALPVVAGVARFVAKKLRASGREGLAGRVDQAVDLVSPKKKAKKKRGPFRR